MEYHLHKADRVLPAENERTGRLNHAVRPAARSQLAHAVSILPPQVSVGASRRESRPTSSATRTDLNRGGAGLPGAIKGREERSTTETTEKAILAGGSFWGMQDLLRKRPGVISRVGYTGGNVPNATYRHHGTHAEAIEIVFDPQQISYGRVYWLARHAAHAPPPR